MAFMTQDKKRELAPAIKKVLAKYGVKGSIAVRNHSTLVVTLAQGNVDFGENLGDRGNTQVNPYWIEKSWSGEACQFLLELKSAMMQGNHDNSDIMTDYFDVGWYIDINIGKWNKPYICNKIPA